MKRLIISSALIFIFSYGFSQDLDRTGFVGEVTSLIVIEVNEATETEVETVTETIITFDSKSISLNDESYDIVSKEFDGIDLNTFLVILRGSNYTISYIVDDFIAISDNSKPDLVTYYMELSE